jgi:integrase
MFTERVVMSHIGEKLMNVVQPIRDKKKIEQLKAQLRKSGDRDYMLAYFGLNSGLRISDYIGLTVADVRGKEKLYIKERKTGNRRFVPIAEYFKREIERYTKYMKDDEYLFPSREKKHGHINRNTAYRIISEAAKKCEIPDIGTHSLRKSFGYHHYQTHHDVAILQHIFGHSSPSITLTYIGISEDEILKSIEAMDEL